MRLRRWTATTLFALAAPAMASATQSAPEQAVIEAAAIDPAEAVGGAPAYDPSRDATADVNAALAAAQASGKHVLLVMGGDWCHDSMELWHLFQQPRFAAMLAQRYEVVWVDVGHRDRNLDIATRFGLDGIRGTPTVLILTPQGTAINLEDAPRWRNAASRKPEAIYRHFSRAVAPRTGD